MLSGSLLSFIFVMIILVMFINLNYSFSMKLWGVWVLCLVFLTLLFFNLGGLISYTWTWSMYPVYSFYLALMVWSVFCLSGMFYLDTAWAYRSWGHYLPLSSPSWLWLFLPLIEVISQVIRPLTLTLRLSANLVAGHSILFLIGCLPWNLLSITGFMIFVPFEVMVAVVQSVVFSLLLQTYSLER